MHYSVLTPILYKVARESSFENVYFEEVSETVSFVHNLGLGCLPARSSPPLCGSPVLVPEVAHVEVRQGGKCRLRVDLVENLGAVAATIAAQRGVAAWVRRQERRHVKDAPVENDEAALRSVCLGNILGRHRRRLATLDQRIPALINLQQDIRRQLVLSAPPRRRAARGRKRWLR